MKQDYELMLVLNPALSREEDATARERVRELITSNGGTIAKEDVWGTRRLAYTIKKAGQDYMEGVYCLYKFDLEPDLVASIQRPPVALRTGAEAHGSSDRTFCED